MVNGFACLLIAFSVFHLGVRALPTAEVTAKVFDPVPFPNVFVTSRIVRGLNAQTGQLPYQALLISGTNNNQGQSVCGGSIISNDWILTAAHCVLGTTSTTVQLGSVSFRAIDAGTVRQLADRVIVHPQYSERNAANDVALVHLSRPITFTDRIKAIRLAPSTSGTFAGQSAVASGWGLTTSRVQQVSQRLQYAPLNIINNSECARIYGSRTITSSIVCARGASLQSTCQGDSGGPLVVNSPQQLLVGVVSFGPADGCDSGIPQAFQRVSSFIGWIRTNTGLQQL